MFLRFDSAQPQNTKMGRLLLQFQLDLFEHLGLTFALLFIKCLREALSGGVVLVLFSSRFGAGVGATAA